MEDVWNPTPLVRIGERTVAPDAVLFLRPLGSRVRRVAVRPDLSLGSMSVLCERMKNELLTRAAREAFERGCLAWEAVVREGILFTGQSGEL